jgi:hypothetical protein
MFSRLIIKSAHHFKNHRTNYVPFSDGFFTLQAFWWATRALLHVHPVDAGSWNPLLYHVWYRPAPCQGKGDHHHMPQFSYRLQTSALYRKYDLCIPRNETARPQSQFLHSGFCERFTCIYSHDRSAYSSTGK